MNVKWQGKPACKYEADALEAKGGFVLYGHRSKSKANIEVLGSSLSQFIWLLAINLSRHSMHSDFARWASNATLMSSGFARW